MVIICPKCNFTATLSDPGRLNLDNPPPCPRCQSFMTWPDQHVLAGVARPGAESTAQPEVDFPWEARSSWLDLVAAWRTTLSILFSPVKTFSSLSYSRGVSSSLGYALVYGSLGHVVGRYWLTLAGIQYGILEADPLGNSIRFAATALLAPALLLVYILVWTGLTHLFLRLLGGIRRPLSATLQVVAYVSGATSLLNVIPYLGNLLIPPWALILYCIGLATAHQTSKVRVLVALLLPFAIVVTVIIGVVILIATIGIIEFLDSLRLPV